MRWFKGIAALLMLVLMMPLARACAAVSHGTTVQPECCQPHRTDSCCEGSSKLCCAVQAPADTTSYPGQNLSPVVLPPASVAVLHPHRADSLKSGCLALTRPVQHSPPGLVIAATTVLRI